MDVLLDHLKDVRLYLDIFNANNKDVEKSWGVMSMAHENQYNHVAVVFPDLCHVEQFEAPEYLYISRNYNWMLKNDVE